MTTFTLKDYIDNMENKNHEAIQEGLSKLTWSEKIEVMQTLEELEKRKKESKDVEIMIEPIPFVGHVQIQGNEGIPLIWKQEDQESTERMLRDQLRIQNEEIMRLKRKIRELENND